MTVTEIPNLGISTYMPENCDAVVVSKKADHVRLKPRSQIEMILGVDMLGHVLTGETVKLHNNLFGWNTTSGWSLMGNVNHPTFCLSTILESEQWLSQNSDTFNSQSLPIQSVNTQLREETEVGEAVSDFNQAPMVSSDNTRNAHCSNELEFDAMLQKFWKASWRQKKVIPKQTR